MRLSSSYELIGALGFKALAYNVEDGLFHSPQQKEHIWDSTVQTAVCKFTSYQNGDPIKPEDKHVAGGKGCWCGFHVTYDAKIALDYAEKQYSQVCPMFVLEARGVWQPHEAGFRSQQVIMRYAVLPAADWNVGVRELGATEKATYIASDRFSIPVISYEEALIQQDVWNVQILEKYSLRHPDLQGVSRSQLLELAKNMY